MGSVLYVRVLTTLWLGSVVNVDHSSRHSYSDIGNTTVQGNVGEEIFICWFNFTHIIIVDNDGVVLGDISCVELYDLTWHWYIVTISYSCIGSRLIFVLLLAGNILAVPSSVLTTRVKGRGAPAGWLKTLMLRVTLPSVSVVTYESGS